MPAEEHFSQEDPSPPQVELLKAEECPTCDLDEIVSNEGDAEASLTFCESRLEVTGLQRTPRVRSYPDLVDINLMYPDETYHEHINTLAFDNLSNESQNKKQYLVRSEDDNNIDISDKNEHNKKHNSSSYCTSNNCIHCNKNYDNDKQHESEADYGDEAQSFDCFKFVLLLRLLNSQQQPKNNNNNDDNDETTEKAKNDKTIENNRKKSIELSKTPPSGNNLNSWVKKMKKSQVVRTLRVEDLGIELADMAGEGQCCCNVEETCMNFEKLKAFDVWQQISNYCKGKANRRT